MAEVAWRVQQTSSTDDRAACPKSQWTAIASCSSARSCRTGPFRLARGCSSAATPLATYSFASSRDSVLRKVLERRLRRDARFVRLPQRLIGASRSGDVKSLGNLRDRVALGLPYQGQDLHFTTCAGAHGPEGPCLFTTA